MPITKSAKKSVIQTKKRMKRNRLTKEVYKNAIKNTLKLVTAKKETEAKVSLNKAYKLIDLAVKKQVISWQAAARRKSKLARMIGETSKESEQTDEGKK